MDKKMNLYWSKSADNYDHIIHDEYNSFRAARWTDRILRNAGEKPADSDSLRVLDCGCGPGFFSVLMAAAGCNVTGIDGSEEMLARAKARAKELGVSVDFRIMDCQETEFADDTFDLIVSRNVTHALNYHRETYAEWKRILRPGGVLLIFDANWHLTRLPGPLREEAARRHAECMRIYGDDFTSRGKSDEPDQPGRAADDGPAAKPHVLGDKVRPDYDLGLLEGLGFRKISTERDITQEMWDDKERLLFGATPMFMIRAVK